MIVVLIGAILISDGATRLRPQDLALAALFVMPFQAVGLAPIAVILRGSSLSNPADPLLLALVGAAIGTVTALPFCEGLSLLGSTFSAVCGAVSALIWFAFNREPIKPKG